jgi:hypothetical protein
MEVSAESLRRLDELVRVGHQDLRDGFFKGLLIFTAIVAIGVLLEFVEHLPIRKTYFSSGRLVVRYSLTRWIKRFSWISTIVVVIGVGAEGIFEGLTSRADGILQDFNQILLADAERQASIADERAITAIRHGEELEKEEDALRTRTEREIDARVALEKDTLWRGPRDVLIRASGDRIPAAVRRFAGQLFMTSICWPAVDSSDRTPFPPANNELLLTAQAIRNALVKAGWIIIRSPQWLDWPTPVPNCTGPGVWTVTRANAPPETRRAAEAVQSAVNRVLQQILPFGGEPTWGIDAIGNVFPREGIEVHIGTHPVLPGNPELTVPPQH